jgi:hypothetical protein
MGLGVIDNCYVAPNAAFTNTAGLVGRVNDDQSMIRNNVWDIETTNTTIGFNQGGNSMFNHGLTTEHMQMQSVYEMLGWDFDDLWFIHPDVNGGYPYLRSMFDGDIYPPPIDVVGIPDELSITISWEHPNSIGNNILTGYRIERSDLAIPVAILDQDSISFTDIDLCYHTTYYYSISALYYLDKVSVAVHLNGIIPLPVVSCIDIDIEHFSTRLIGSYPNPFNPQTTIKFAVQSSQAGSEFVEINIYNIRGQLIRRLVSREYASGNHQVIWDGKDDSNVSVGSGIYFYRTYRRKKCC